MNSRAFLIALSLNAVAAAPVNAQIEHMRQTIFGMD
jgi:hypothetical protein